MMKTRFPLTVATAMAATLWLHLVAVPGMAQDLKVCVGGAPGQYLVVSQSGEDQEQAA